MLLELVVIVDSEEDVIRKLRIWGGEGLETKGQTDVDDLHLKLSDALDCCKWRRIIRGN